VEPEDLRAALDEQLPGWDDDSRRRGPAAPDCHVTVVVTARGRHEALAAGVESVLDCDWRSFDVVVVDSGKDGGSADFLRARFGAHPQLRCVEEPRDGLSFARNAGLAVASGEIVAFTDEGVLVDEGWIGALVDALEETGAECVTGPALPLELETSAQTLAEQLTGSPNEAAPRTLSLADSSVEGLAVRAAEQLGAGLNLALRAQVYQEIGQSEEAAKAYLDVIDMGDGGGQLGIGTADSDSQGVTSQNANANAPAGAPPAAGRMDLIPGTPQQVNGYEYSFLGTRSITGITVRRDPGSTFIWVATALLLFGLAVTFYVPRRRLWVRIAADRTQMAGVADRVVNFAAEMRRIGAAAGSPDAQALGREAED